jgi:FkbM family methyltransferase
MFRLVLIRAGGRAQKRYVLRIPGYRHPVVIRGGQSSDAIALYEVMVTREYELTAQLDSPAFIIDGGANIGMASLFFLNRYPTSKVVAVEPDPANFEICRLNLEPYGNRVTLIRGGIWKTPGHLALQSSQQEWTTSVRDDPSGTVEAFTLPSLIALGSGKVDLLKLDIEGSEGELFADGAPEWLRRVHNIAIELHGTGRKDGFFAAMAGYRYDGSCSKTWDESENSCYIAICQNIRPQTAIEQA